MSSKDLIGQRFGKLVARKKIKKSDRTYYLCDCDCGGSKEVYYYNLVKENIKSCGCIPTYKSLIGQRFGKLVVVEDTGKRKHKKIVYLCRCDCGNMKETVAEVLVNKKIKSCGCAWKNDLTGKRFGKLLVLGISEKRKRGIVTYNCRCDCGNIKDITYSDLYSGDTISCGCHKSYESLVGERFERLEVIEETEKRDVAGGVVYLCKCDCGNNTEVSANSLRSGNTRSCGCLSIENCLEMKNKLNYIEGTLIESLNDTVRSDNSSGVRGVSYIAKRGLWLAYLGFKGKVYRFGPFKDKGDAVKARKRAEEEIWGKFKETINK